MMLPPKVSPMDCVEQFQFGMAIDEATNIGRELTGSRLGNTSESAVEMHPTLHVPGLGRS